MTRVLSSVVLALTLSTVASATDAIRNGLTNGITPSTPTSKLKYQRCPAGQYLVGLSATQTDRMIGYWQTCAAAPSYGVWSGSANVQFSLGAAKGGGRVAKTCPQGYFIVGLAGTLGIYTRDAHGAAVATPPPLVADLQPVCRQLLRPSAIYALPRGYFENAEDNNLSDVGYDGLSGKRSCPAGQAAVGIAFFYDGGRDLDPANQFQDAALICDRMLGTPPNYVLTTK